MKGPFQIPMLYLHSYGHVRMIIKVEIWGIYSLPLIRSMLPHPYELTYWNLLVQCETLLFQPCHFRAPKGDF